MSPPNPDRFKVSHDGLGYLLAIGGAVLFSFKAVLAKLAFIPLDADAAAMGEVAIDPLTLMVLRLGFSMPVYLIIWWMVTRKNRARGHHVAAKTMAKVAGLGVLCYYVCTLLDFSGLQYITAQLERLILFTYPVFVVIFGALFFGGRITKWGAAAVIIAYSGIALIFAVGNIAVGSNVPLGSALVMSSAVLFALYQLLSKGLIDQVGAKLFTCIAMTAAATVTGLHFITLHGGIDGARIALDLPPRLYVIGAAIALFSTILPSFMIATAVGRVGPQAVAILAMIGPAATIAGAVFILSEPFGWVDALGTAITMIGIGLYTLIDKRAKIKARSVDPAFIR
ncbi:DMT family transporter [Fretibacter rubidus]|uniref:DMT family transporter n=1 Tax=Fretibacter rubidus TaxID=570162 RepID=UPI00352B184D